MKTAIIASAFVLFALLASPALAAPQDFGLEVQRSDAILKDLGAKLTCAGSTNAKIEKELRGKATPRQLQESDTSRRSQYLAMVTTPLRAMAGARPELLNEMTRASEFDATLQTFGLSQKDFKEYLLSGRKQYDPPLQKLSSRRAVLTIQNEVPELCDKRCEYNVLWNTITAVTLWRGLCMACSEDFLTVVSSSSGTWVDSRVQTWLKTNPTDVSKFPIRGDNSAGGHCLIPWPRRCRAFRRESCPEARHCLRR